MKFPQYRMFINVNCSSLAYQTILLSAAVHQLQKKHFGLSLLMTMSFDVSRGIFWSIYDIIYPPLAV